jgi:hypothetical protein
VSAAVAGFAFTAQHSHSCVVTQEVRLGRERAIKAMQMAFMVLAMGGGVRKRAGGPNRAALPPSGILRRRQVYLPDEYPPSIGIGAGAGAGGVFALQAMRAKLEPRTAKSSRAVFFMMVCWTWMWLLNGTRSAGARLI